MRSVQTQTRFPLSSVKPLDGLERYRAQCLAATRKALSGPTRRRNRSPISQAPLETAGHVGDLEYLRCPQTGSLFMAELPEPARWAELLSQVSQFRNSPEGLHAHLKISRTDHVTLPKLEWIRGTLRIQERIRPRLLEVTTPPSPFTEPFRESGLFPEVRTVSEMDWIHTPQWKEEGSFEAAVLFESLDRVDEPVKLIQRVAEQLVDGGLLFVTALVSSGFDISVLGIQNRYLYPPDRTNCFSLVGLRQLLEEGGFMLVEVSTPGVLDVEIVQAHIRNDPSIPLSRFEQQILSADKKVRSEFQVFLQEQGFSSFARIVARKRG